MRSAFCGGVCRTRALFPPRRRKAWHQSVLAEILQQRVASSRGLRQQRGVKRNQTKFQVIHERGRPERTDFANSILMLK